MWFVQSRRTWRARRVLSSVAAVLMVTVTVSCASSTSKDPDHPEPPLQVNPPPNAPRNVLFFFVDDMDDFACSSTAEFLPMSSPWLAEQGQCFENTTVTSPVCCPSRAATHTGQYNHNNRVLTQKDAVKLRVADSLQRLLTRAGLSTYGNGKYFNGVKAWRYESGNLASGFESSDFWQGMRYYGYQLWDDEKQEPVKPPDQVHVTVRTGDLTMKFLEGAVDRREPFYSYVGFKAPHTQNLLGSGKTRFPEPTEANKRRPVPPFDWRPEKDTSDKLPFIGHLGHGRKYFDAFYRSRVRALYDVDEQMARVMQYLEDTGELDRTLIVFASDNGFHLGSNGWEGKGLPYVDSLAVPMLIRYPAVFEPGTVDRRQVSLVDIAPTVLDLLGIRPNHVLDGHSLAGDYRRRGTYHEFTNEKNKLVAEESGEEATHIPSWAAYRIGARAYIEFYDRSGGILKREFYADLAQKQNLLSRAFANRRPSDRVLARFERLLHQARTCRGTRESHATNPCP
jgi:arylsulfatase A-like enzyme